MNSSDETIIVAAPSLSTQKLLLLQTERPDLICPLDPPDPQFYARGGVFADQLTDYVEAYPVGVEQLLNIG